MHRNCCKACINSPSAFNLILCKYYKPEPNFAECFFCSKTCTFSLFLLKYLLDCGKIIIRKRCDEGLNHKFQYITDLCNCLRLEIMYIFHRTLDTSWHFDDLCNDYNRLYFVLDGHGRVFNNEESVDLLPGNIYMIPANSHYNYRCEDHLEKIFLHFHLRIMPERDVLSNIKRIVKIESSVDEIEKIKDICYEEDIMSAMFFQNYIRSLTAKIL